MDGTPSTTAVANGIPNLPADFVRDWGEWSGKIVDAAKAQASAVRVCQKVWVADSVSGTTVPDDSLDLPVIANITEKSQKPLVEITIPFTLTSDEMNKEPNTKIGSFLAQANAMAVGQLEDLILFQGKNAAKNPLVSSNIVSVIGINNADAGLLGAAEPGKTDDNDPTLVSTPIEVHLSEKAMRGVLWGENFFAAVTAGITKLTGKGQSTTYALFLPIAAYADAKTPPGDQSLVAAYDRLKDWVDFHATAMLPPDRGLLVAVSNAIALYVSVHAQPEYVTKDGSLHKFLVRDKFQFIARDPRALVLLKFDKPPKP